MKCSANPKDALDVMDFEAAARKALPPAHWGYMASGVDDNLTRDMNHEAYKHIQLRPRKLIDVCKIDTRVELFGTTWDSPIFLCPVGAQGMFHADGEIGVARAAQAKKSLQILSTVTSHSVEDVIKARGGPVWYQLYAVSNWGLTEKDGQASRRRRLPGAGLDHRSAGRPKHRDGIPLPAHRRPAVRRVVTASRSAPSMQPARCSTAST